MSTMIAEFTLPSAWEHDTDIDLMNDEELSASSNEEASKAFDQWQSGSEMHVDEQLGAKLLSDDLFNDPCMSPTGPLENLS